MDPQEILILEFFTHDCKINIIDILSKQRNMDKRQKNLNVHTKNQANILKQGKKAYLKLNWQLISVTAKHTV